MGNSKPFLNADRVEEKYVLINFKVARITQPLSRHLQGKLEKKLELTLQATCLEEFSILHLAIFKTPSEKRGFTCIPQASNYVQKEKKNIIKSIQLYCIFRQAQR